MANATVETKEVTKTIVTNEEVVTLELTRNEAQVIMDIFAGVSGDPYTTYRKYTDGVYDALQRAGFDYRSGRFIYTSHAAHALVLRDGE